MPDSGNSSTGSNARWEASHLARGYSIEGIRTAAADSFLERRIALGGTSPNPVCAAINRGLGLAPPQHELNLFDTVYDAHPGEPFYCFYTSFMGAVIYRYVHTLSER